MEIQALIHDEHLIDSYFDNNQFCLEMLFNLGVLGINLKTEYIEAKKLTLSKLGMPLTFAVPNDLKTEIDNRIAVLNQRIPIEVQTEQWNLAIDAIVNNPDGHFEGDHLMRIISLGSWINIGPIMLAEEFIWSNQHMKAMDKINGIVKIGTELMEIIETNSGNLLYQRWMWSVPIYLAENT